MRLNLRLRRMALAVTGGIVLALGATGCALRATTDFGPQSESSKRSLNVGPEGMPGIPVTGGGSHPGGDGSTGTGEPVFDQ
jgi:hypothetical protein